MGGMSEMTGKYIDDFGGDESHIIQSIHDIIVTPLGSRPLYKEYGSNVYKYIDRPINQAIDIYHAVAEGIERHEPRFALESVSIDVDENEPSRLTISIQGVCLTSKKGIKFGVKI